MLKRAIVCAIMLALVGVAIIFRPIAFPILVVVFGLAAQWEVYSVFLQAGYKPIIWTGMLFVACQWPVYHFFGLSGCVAAYLVLTAVSLVWAAFMPERRLQDTMASIFAMFYPGWCLCTLIAINGMEPTQLADIGAPLVLLVPSMSDMGGYLGGRWFGKHKLAPRVSPKKTVEGAVGGLIFGVITAVVIGLVARYALHLTLIPMACYPFIGLFMSIFGQIGDLTASALKRATGVKDFSRLLGEHGGMMDRADSVLMGAIALFTFYCIVF